MKVGAFVCEKCQLIRMQDQIIVICSNTKHKQRQGYYFNCDTYTKLFRISSMRVKLDTGYIKITVEFVRMTINIITNSYI